jgi:phage gp29-like protein
MKFLDAVKNLINALKSDDDSRAPETARRDRLVAVMGATPEDIGAAMRRALSGDQEGFAKLCALFDQYVRNEPRLRAVVEKRRRKVIQWPWKIVPADPDDATAQADADFLESVFKGVPKFRRTVLWELTDAIGKGMAAVRLTGDLRDGKLVVARAEGYPQYALRHPVDLRTGLPDPEHWECNDAISGIWQPVPDGKLLVYSREEQGSYLTGGLMWPTLWYACFKNFTIKDWLAFIEVYGVPIRIGKVPSEFRPGSREWETVATAVMNAASDSGAVISKDAEINVLDAMKGAASDSFKSAAQYFDDAQAELWLGGTLTMSAGDKGARSLGDVHLDEEFSLTISDSEDLAETLTEFGRYLIAANFGERPAYPTFEFDTRLPKDIQKESTALVPILQLGVPVDLDGLYENFMPWGKPSGDGEVFIARNPAAGPQPPLDAETGRPGDAGTGRLAALSASELATSHYPLATFPDDLIDGLAASGANAAASAYGALIDALDANGDAPADALLAFRQSLRDALAPIIAASRMAGAVHLVDEARLKDARSAINEAVLALADMPAALSAPPTTYHLPSTSLAAIDISGDAPILQRDESGRILWSRVKPRAAMDWWAKRIGVTDTVFDALDESARGRAFTIAGMESQKIIDAAHAEIAQALESGSTAQEFKKSMKAAGWNDAQHAEQVFTQNILSAYSAGREAALTSPAVMKYLPNSTLHTMRDALVRAEHRRLEGITLRSDDPARKKLATPMYYGCRCWWGVADPSTPLTDPATIAFPPAEHLWGEQ